MSDEREAHIALVQQMAAPLTALENYLGVASRLNRADTPASRRRLADAIMRSNIEVAKANLILQQMRDLLQK
jgi:hypothetical protein